MCEPTSDQPATLQPSVVTEGIKSYGSLRDWLALSRAPQPHIRLYNIVTTLGSIANVFTANSTVLRQHGATPKQIAYLRKPPWSNIDAALEHIYQHNWHVLTLQSPNYPTLLKQITDPPIVLFVDGDPALLSQPQMAIVGSRNPSVDGIELAHDFAQSLSNHHITITSGLALGIDAASHRGALASTHPHTIAVIATGLDKCYPARHRALAEQIRNHDGTIITEFLPGTAPHPHHFPQRNRLISGLSQGVLVVEATLRSGSLITARFALEQNREVFAIPGAIHNPMTKGCHHLLREGAHLVEHVDDILAEITHIPTTPTCDKKLDTCTLAPLDNDHAFLLKCVGYQVTSIEQIVIRSKLPAAKVATLLTNLTLSGYVKPCINGYARCTRLPA